MPGARLTSRAAARGQAGSDRWCSGRL